MKKTIMAFLVSTALLALNAPARAEWVGGLTVNKVRVQEYGCILVTVNAGYFNTNGWLVIRPDFAGANRMHSIAMAAKLAGRTIAVYRYQMAPSASPCWGLGDYISDIEIE